MDRYHAKVAAGFALHENRSVIDLPVEISHLCKVATHRQIFVAN